ncbi:glucose-6-phosphate dehydrogenase [Oceanobacillus damuensis]|uniref:glucose-6-phosphate dehydrogenase n=1 Tax=Oceanobacillus damuensis TaxID=937928 RepID=UPI000A054389|nr:glucose-6-phosphate dehydrogenase [Oceanobacillus damuensis]
MDGIAVKRNIDLEDNSISNVKSLELDSATMVLFGATGDLAKRKVFPALYNLFLDGKIPDSFSVIGLGRRDWSNESFQTHIKESLTTFSRRLPADHSRMEEFIQAFQYSTLDVNNDKEYIKLLELIQRNEEELNIPENRLFYLSVAPQLFDAITMNIKKSGLSSTKGWKRLIIEKPFGEDLKTAQQLNKKLSIAFDEDEIYRIDHYLGKSMVQNLEALKFANPVIKTLWTNEHIANVQITASETVGIENRADFYEKSGAIRDMVQNHMLQMLMMTAVYLPKNDSIKNIRKQKSKIMESLQPIQKEGLHSDVIRGQYRAGEVLGKPVVGYTEEQGVSETSKTDTFIAARIRLEDPFWSGVPFYIRTGKRMKEKSTRIVIEFKNPFEDVCNTQNKNLPPNILIIEISPNEGVFFRLNSRNPLKDGEIEPITVEFSKSQKDIPEAYELLLFDALQGDQTFFAHWRELELSWEWIQPILEAFKEDNLPLHMYPSGSMGPEAANQLLKDDGFKWW